MTPAPRRGLTMPKFQKKGSEDMEAVLNAVPGILVALAAIIPVAVKLVNTIQSLVREKRWSELMKIVVDFMEIAEEKLATGQDRREFVIAMTRQAAIEAGYEFDEKVIGEMIDSLAQMAKVVNAPKPDETPAPESEGVNPV